MVNPLLQELKQQKTAGKNPRRNTKPCKMKGWIEAMQEELASVQATNVKGGNTEKVSIKMKLMHQLPEIEAIRLFLAFASFMGFSVYQMDVKSAFLYGNITEEIMIGMSYVFDCIKTTLKFADLSLYSDYAGDNMIEKQHLVDVNILEADWFLGSARKQINCIYLITEQICSSCRDVVDRFLWMQNHSLNYEQSTFETHASFSSRIGYDQRLINVVKEHTDDNVADLLTKGFDLASGFNNFGILRRSVNLMKLAHIEAKVAGKKILVSEASVRTDLMFNDEDGTNCFNNQCSPKFSGKLTPLTPPMLEVATAAESSSPVASKRSASPNDYTPTDEVQTSGGDEGHLDLYGLTRVVLKLKKQTAKQAAQILRLKTKVKILVKKVKPVGGKKVSDGSTGLNEDDVSDQEEEQRLQRTERENFTEEQKGKVFGGDYTRSKGELEQKQQAALRRTNLLPFQNEQAIKEMNVKAEEPSKKEKKVVDFEGDSAQYVEVMKQRSSISRFSIVQSPEGNNIDVQRAKWAIRAFNTLNGSLHYIGTVQDLHNLHRLVIEYYEHIPPTGLGLILHGDLTTMMETTEESDDELWRNQTEWEIIKWRLYESTRVHILELENGTIIHMLVEQRYPLIRELMQRMLEHKLEVQNETENALNVIRFVMKQKEDLEREEE
ncbi:copia protein [Tanacetum coccineum]